ncbi:MAG: hypothetical protein JWL81_2509 [Verrucomicrobiales bacterium]|nr:hypothetical protein [Verrucomicrobiales bacterium]
MTTIKKVSSTLLQGLGLHKGDFLTVMDESDNGFVIQITTASEEALSPQDHQSDKRAALARFAAGTEVLQPSTDQEMDDARYAALKAKHLK